MQTIYTIHPSGLVLIAKRDYTIDPEEGHQTGIGFVIEPEGYIRGDGVPFSDDALLARIKSAVITARTTKVEQTIRIGEARPIPQAKLSYVERQAKAKVHDDLYNEGGDGYNPYRWRF